jgi:hypothetical protein
MRIAIPAAAAAMLFPVTCFAQATFRPPTATELFDLRSKCSELAQKKRIKQINDDAKDNPDNPPFLAEYSRYDAATNRCYVLIVREYTRPTSEHRTLYDGQTNKVLALTIDTYSGLSRSAIGFVSDKNYKETSNGDPSKSFSEAYEYIEKKMSD